MDPTKDLLPTSPSTLNNKITILSFIFAKFKMLKKKYEFQLLSVAFCHLFLYVVAAVLMDSCRPDLSHTARKYDGGLNADPVFRGQNQALGILLRCGLSGSCWWCYRFCHSHEWTRERVGYMPLRIHSTTSGTGECLSSATFSSPCSALHMCGFMRVYVVWLQVCMLSRLPTMAKPPLAALTPTLPQHRRQNIFIYCHNILCPYPTKSQCLCEKYCLVAWFHSTCTTINDAAADDDDDGMALLAFE